MKTDKISDKDDVGFLYEVGAVDDDLPLLDKEEGLDDEEVIWGGVVLALLVVEDDEEEDEDNEYVLLLLLNAELRNLLKPMSLDGGVPFRLLLLLVRRSSDPELGMAESMPVFPIMLALS